jgi:hypothetical protein
MSRTCQGLLVAVALLVLGNDRRLAQAQSSSEAAATRAAQLEHRTAVRAYADGRYAEAVEHFAAADRLQPNPAFSFNIAKAYDAQGDVAHALSAYREYLRRAKRPADMELVTQRIQELALLLGERGLQQLTVRSTPPGAAVFLESEPIGVTPVTLEVPPGQHALKLRASGHRSVDARVDLSREQPLEVAFALEPEREEASFERAQLLPASANGRMASPHTARSSSDRPGAVMRTVGIAALGASVAALGGAVTFEILRSKAESQAKQEREQVSAADQLETMRTRQTVARVLAGTGGALAAVGGVLLIAGSITGQERRGQGLALACQPNKCQAVYSGKF